MLTLRPSRARSSRPIPRLPEARGDAGSEFRQPPARTYGDHPGDGRGVSMTTYPPLAIEATGLVKAFGDVKRRRRRRPRGPQRLGLRRARPERRRQDDDDPDAGDAAAPRRRVSARVLGPRHRRARPTRCAGRQPHRPARVGRRGPHRPREPDPDRPAARPEARRAPRRAPTSCSRPSASPTRPGAWSRTTPAGCGGGSTSRRASSSRRS